MTFGRIKRKFLKETMGNLNKIIGAVLFLVLVLGGVFFFVRQRISPQKPQPAPPSFSVSEITPAVSEIGSFTISVTEAGFLPPQITIKKGVKVVWENKSLKTIQINSSPHPQHTDYPPLNLGEVAPGVSTSLIFENIGSFNYHNHSIPSQTGTVVVIE